MASLLTYVINGALMGLLYALIALSFVIIYRSARVFNFAQGEIIVVAAFLIWTFFNHYEFDWWLALPLAVGCSILIGLIIERLILRRLIGEEIFSFVMVTIGLLILLRGIVLVVWGPEMRFFPAVLPLTAVRIGSIVIDPALLYGGIITILLAGLASWFYNKTQLGLEMSAVAEDHQTAMSLGISVRKSIAISWALSGVFSAIAAIVFLNGKGLTFAASDIGFAALPVVLLAGLESIGGVIIAGLIIGVTANLAAYYLDPIFDGGVAQVLPFIIMIAILLIRPTGMFGWKTIDRI